MLRRSETSSQDPAHLLALAADFDRLVGVTAPAPQAPEIARSAAAEPLLDSNGKSTRGTGSEIERQGAARTLDRYRLQRHAAKILDWPKALSGCEYARQYGTKVIEVWQNKAADRGSWTRFVGLQTCKSVWNCPICSNRRAWVRRGQLQQLIDYAEAQGLTLVMLTLTSQHDLDTSLLAQRTMMKKAKAAMTGRAGFKNGLGQHLLGSVTATEVTHGAHSGWHLHFHYIMLLDLRHLPAADRDAAGAALGEAAWPAWEGAARCAGLHVSRKAYSVDVGETVAAYPGQVEKIEGNWTLADEATRGTAKKAAGRHPFELLRLSCDEGDEHARQLFIEYAAGMKNVRALRWSRGLADLVGIDADEAGDEDGDTPEDKPEVMSSKAGDLELGEWHGDVMRPGVRARRGRMSIAVARDGVAGFHRERDNGKKDPHAEDLAQTLIDLGVAPEELVDLIEDDDGSGASIRANKSGLRRGPKAASPQGAQVPEGTGESHYHPPFLGGVIMCPWGGGVKTNVVMFLPPHPKARLERQCREQIDHVSGRSGVGES